MSERMEWRPISSAPPNVMVLAAWPQLKLDEDDELTDQATGQFFVGVTCRGGGQWDEPEALNAMGSYFGDDVEWAAEPTHWMPLPKPPFAQGTGGAELLEVVEAYFRYEVVESVCGVCGGAGEIPSGDGRDWCDNCCMGRRAELAVSEDQVIEAVKQLRAVFDAEPATPEPHADAAVQPQATAEEEREERTR